MMHRNRGLAKQNIQQLLRSRSHKNPNPGLHTVDNVFPGNFLLNYVPQHLFMIPKIKWHGFVQH
jgi:hypothetical protein